MIRTLTLAAALLVALATPVLAQEEVDPFAETDDPFGSVADPFAALEQNVSATEETLVEGVTEEEPEEEAAPAPAPAASPEPEAAPVAKAPAAGEEKGAPGFEVVFLVGAIGAALIVMRRK